jgi:hypothetical protein
MDYTPIAIPSKVEAGRLKALRSYGEILGSKLSLSPRI